MRRLLLVAVVTMISACATGAQHQSRMPFPESEYQALAKTGTGIVKGRAFVEIEGGLIKTAAGNEVILNPVTSYSMEWYEKAYLPGMAMVEADSRLSKYILTQVIDAEGRFVFRNVPPGEYFVTTRIVWESSGGQGSPRRRGGTITKRIMVKDGHETEAILTR